MELIELAVYFLLENCIFHCYAMNKLLEICICIVVYGWPVHNFIPLTLTKLLGTDVTNTPRATSTHCKSTSQQKDALI